MKNITRMMIAAAAIAASLTAAANRPDSVYLFSYARPDGSGGLRMAWSADGKRWNDIDGGAPMVSSDFGPWGSHKKMFAPRLVQDAATGGWTCTWNATPDGSVVAVATSDDLLKWNPQRYFRPGDERAVMPQSVHPVTDESVTLSSGLISGNTQKVPYSTVERLVTYGQARRYREMLNSECTAQDGVRFAGLAPVDARFDIRTDSGRPMSDKMIGIFFEDINYGADGGLYAELVQNRDFEYSSADCGNWDATYAWSLAGTDARPGTGTDSPLHANNRHYAVLPSGATLVNDGYDGMTLGTGLYDFSVFTKMLDGKSGSLTVSLTDSLGDVVATQRIKVPSKDWRKLTAQLRPERAVENGRIEVRFDGAKSGDGARVAVDMVSLFPRDTFKGRRNGLRADLAQALADLHPRFVRFPGGCVAHGDGIDNIYDWKGSVGPLESRRPLRNLWGYHQTRGLGYFEYFLFCEDIGAEPLPVVAAGVPCQNSGTYAHHSTDDLTGRGQQQGIPHEEMQQYIQDILDLIEYANGDPKRSQWARMRAEAGHPKPFNLKYIGIGNEDMITEVFEERFRMINDAITEAYPDITVIGTVGPFFEGADYERGWEVATEQKVPVVDEHYYVHPGWMVNNQDYYDNYDRSKPKVYLGEYAAHLPGRPNNVETALAEALYLTAVERNSDVVTMTSYAPLLAKKGHTQWRPDMIFFDNGSVTLTPDYYVQKMYGTAPGAEYLDTDITLSDASQAVSRRIGISASRDAAGDYIVRLVNLLPVAVNAGVNLDAAAIRPQTARVTLLSGRPDSTDAVPAETELEIGGPDFTYTLPAYSFAVIRIAK